MINLYIVLINVIVEHDNQALSRLLKPSNDRLQYNRSVLKSVIGKTLGIVLLLLQ